MMGTRVVCCLRDKKSGLFLNLVTVPAVGVFYRGIQDEVQRGGEGNTLSSHPSDFDAFQIGQFDDESGELVADMKLLSPVSELVVQK